MTQFNLKVAFTAMEMQKFFVVYSIHVFVIVYLNDKTALSNILFAPLLNCLKFSCLLALRMIKQVKEPLRNVLNAR